VKQKFCLDTSIFINGWWKHYPIDVFPSYWQALDKLMEEGIVFSCFEVYEELKRQDDALLKWAKKHRKFFEDPTEDTFLQLQELMKEYPNFAAASGTLNAADPWVISHAMPTRAIVVTYEDRATKRKETKPPKIPDVCDDLGMRSMKVPEFLKEMKISF
jgi:PIN domain nuclease of toxin-antitoxin system